MAYDPAETTTRDWIRGLIGDTAATPIIADVTYDSVIARYDHEGYAVAELALRMARYWEARPNQITATGDGSVGWGANRVAALHTLAADWTARADAATAASGLGTVITIESDYLTAPRVETELWRG